MNFTLANTRLHLNEIFNWENWEDGDFGGWQIPEIVNALIKYHNATCGAEMLQILTMTSTRGANVKNLVAKKMLYGISQSVMSFSYAELEEMGQFNDNHQYVRIGTADDNKSHFLGISMSTADVANWIMTNNDYANVVDWMCHNLSIKELYDMLVAFEKYINNEFANGYYLNINLKFSSLILFK